MTGDVDSNGIKGWYGQVNENSFWKYQTSIAPAIFVYRFAHDIAFSKYKVKGLEWNLPDDLMPGLYDGEITPNLLGYAEAAKITSE